MFRAEVVEEYEICFATFLSVKSFSLGAKQTGMNAPQLLRYAYISELVYSTIHIGLPIKHEDCRCLLWSIIIKRDFVPPKFTRLYVHKYV
jgi:hypothetical protein